MVSAMPGDGFAVFGSIHAGVKLLDTKDNTSYVARGFSADGGALTVRF